MILQHQPPLHLTYCLNIHPGESWAENFAAIREKAVAVKHAIAPNEWFGLGLRLAHQAASELAASPELRAEALDFFNANQLYPFTVNGFPYGRFHAGPVKEDVYAPDWRSQERLEYTFQIADILSGWLPDQVDGSISTVPGSFKPWISTDEDVLAMAKNLAATVAYLAALRDDTGKEIHLGLEPEPDCYLETTEETIRFFEEVMLVDGADEVGRLLGCGPEQAEKLVRRHIGVCLDTCHVAMQFENLLDSYRAYVNAGIRISKVQLSAALTAHSPPRGTDALKPFVEPVYLHQVKARGTEGAQYSWYDLPDALAEIPNFPDIQEINVHFHVPLFFNMGGVLRSTVDSLTPEFFQELRRGSTSHLEIETYTLDVIPPELHPGDVVRSVAREYAWVMEKLR
ncbi:MAG: metabolite traffic protein EboE [Chthoniobacteraceae bacterium]